MLKDASSEFKEAKIEIKEVNNEIKDLPDEIVDADGADELPDEISLDSLENENAAEHISENDIPNAVNGGSYRDVKKNSDGETHEVHHMPADSASKLERDDGPAIKMEKGNYSVTLRNPQFLHKVEKWEGSEKNQRNVNIQEEKKVVC